MKDIYNQVYQGYKSGRIPNSIALENAGIMNLEPSIDIGDMFENLDMALTAKRNNLHEGDLIDLLIKTIRAPFPGSILASEQLNTLSKAILNPNELQNLAAQLEKGEAHCCLCSRKLDAGHGVALLRDEITKRMVVYCNICYEPTRASCPQCGDSVRFTHIYKKQCIENCEYHKPKKGLKRKLEPIVVDIEANPGIIEEGPKDDVPF
jgi:hypothetical protein